MISRLKQLMDSLHITKSEFANMLGISPATISHLLSGRNNPSYEIISTINEKFPQISLEWLINGKGEMYNSAEIRVQNPLSPGFFDSQGVIENVKPLSQPELKPVIKEKRICRILIFFSDGTFQEIEVK